VVGVKSIQGLSVHSCIQFHTYVDIQYIYNIIYNIYADAFGFG